MTYYSDWPKLTRAVAYMIKFTRYVKGDAIRVDAIGPQEYRNAEEVLVKLIQCNYLTDGQRKSVAFKKLFPQDVNGTLRIGGRMMLSAMSYDEKQPAVLPICE